MLNKKSFLSIAVIFVLLALPAIAIAQKIDIKTGNMRTLIDDDGEVYIETEPPTTSNQPALKPRSNSTNSSNSSHSSSSNQKNSNCHTESHTYKNNEGSNSVYSHSSTTVCQ